MSSGPTEAWKTQSSAKKLTTRSTSCAFQASMNSSSRSPVIVLSRVAISFPFLIGCRRNGRWRERERLEHELGQLAELELALVAGGLDRVLVHRHVFRAGHDEVVDAAEGDGLVDPALARALRAFRPELLHPDAPPARAAAEGVVAVPRHLDELAAERGEDASRLVVHAVVAPERAGVVVGDPVAEAAPEAQPARLAD